MPVELIDSAESYRQACDAIRIGGGTVGLVPTMGALHEGHMALVHQAKRLTTRVVVTLFVNPTQFSAGEDFTRYPRTLESDRAKCERAGVDLLFVPSVNDMYPPGDSTRVRVQGISETLCGAFRPGHFEGVATVVAKFFGLTGACTAIFGKKDYQQLKVIERLARDLMLPVRVVGHPIVREPDGLAMSSRNAYLSEAERQRARGIAKGLSKACRQFATGQRVASQLIDAVRRELTVHELKDQYVDVADPENLQVLSASENLPDRVVLAVAAFCGSTRLIDNIVLGEDPDPLG